MARFSGYARFAPVLSCIFLLAACGSDNTVASYKETADFRCRLAEAEAVRKNRDAFLPPCAAYELAIDKKAPHKTPDRQVVIGGNGMSIMQEKPDGTISIQPVWGAVRP
jgi:hypothetical protein